MGHMIGPTDNQKISSRRNIGNLASDISYYVLKHLTILLKVSVLHYIVKQFLCKKFLSIDVATV